MGRAEERRHRARAQKPFGGRIAMVAAGSLLLGGGAVVAIGQSAKADSHIHVTGTDSGLALRTEPSTSGGVHWYLADGETTNFKCYTHGEYVDGVQHTDVWFKVWYVRKDGSFQEGFISAAYITATASDLTNLPASWNIPDCGGETFVPEPKFTVTPTHADFHYNREAAVGWALENATHGEPAWGGCSWFVSQALWEGGFPKSWGWNSWTKGLSTDRKNNFHVDGTRNARIAEELFNYLSGGTFAATIQELRGDVEFAGNALPLARLGDIIAYDWDNEGKVDHMSIITNVAPGNYPEVSEWGTDANQTQSHQKTRGWTWSNTSGKYLQEKYPDIKAYLIQFSM